MDESCLTCEGVMSHIWMSHFIYMNESCHTYERVMSHIWMSHVTHMNESCHTYGWVTSHIWMSHVTHINETCHTPEWVMSHVWRSHVTHTNELCHTHTQMTHITHMIWLSSTLAKLWLFFCEILTIFNAKFWLSCSVLLYNNTHTHTPTYSQSTIIYTKLLTVKVQ